MAGANLSRGTFRRAVTDEELSRVIVNGVPGTPMPPSAFKPEQVAQIVAYLRAFPSIRARQTSSGDASRGRLLFQDKGGCLECHRVRGLGSRSGPDLSDIGVARAPAVLERSVRDPTSALLPINRPVRIVMRDGRTILGRRLNEDTHTVQVIDEHERLVSVMKKDVRSFDAARESAMPAYAAKLTDNEIADVVAYLLTLRKP